MSIYSYILTVFSVLFWILRAVITVAFTREAGLPIEPLNTYWEIVVLFVIIPCMIFVFKRNIIGAAAYLGVYVSYFGTALYNNFNSIANEINISNSIDIVMSIVGIVIPVLTFIDILFNKHRKAIIGGNNKTDWFYKNKNYDRNFDERADKNQYKIR